MVIFIIIVSGLYLYWLILLILIWICYMDYYYHVIIFSIIIIICNLIYLNNCCRIGYGSGSGLPRYRKYVLLDLFDLYLYYARFVFIADSAWLDLNWFLYGLNYVFTKIDSYNLFKFTNWVNFLVFDMVYLIVWIV